MARILVVDDEQDTQAMLSDALKHMKHNVIVVGDATRAMALPPDPPFEVAIVDYVLPGMRGVALIHQLKKKYPGMRSIVISGQIDDTVLTEDLVEQQLKERIAADGYLPKPFSTADLASTIQDVLKGTGKVVGGKPAQRMKASGVKKVNKILKKGLKGNS